MPSAARNQDPLKIPQKKQRPTLSTCVWTFDSPHGLRSLLPVGSEAGAGCQNDDDKGYQIDHPSRRKPFNLPLPDSYVAPDLFFCLFVLEVDRLRTRFSRPLFVLCPAQRRCRRRGRCQMLRVKV